MLNASPSLNMLLSTMAQRLHSTESLIQQHEKLSALGKLAAGLAHELNNPASASLRASKQLSNTVNNLHELTLELARLSPSQLQFLREFQKTLLERSKHPPDLDPLTQSDMEQTLTYWMERAGMRDGWQIASILVGAGLTVEQLETLKVMMGTEHLPPALDWLAQSLTASTLLYTLEQSTSRAVELIEAFKGYSYMDRSSRQEINIHEGIENTLLILSHKLKAVTVIREYDPNLPRITAYGPELNQVWTNLIDNAIAAIEGHGHIWIRTAQDEDRVQVEIVDDGPGIPPDIQSRVFDPFFTTKPIGKGTGLGLDITYRIIVEQHHGSIQLFSEPGQTCFKICLPIHQP